MNTTTTEKLVYKMLTTSTGTHFLDSGGDNDRAWQRNQKRTIEDFRNEVEVEIDDQTYNMTKKKYERVKTSEELGYTISIFHYLTKNLTLDATCERFNRLKCLDWDSDVAYGISQKQAEWLERNGLAVTDTWNTYNGDSNLSQVLQGANVALDGEALEFPTYILLQIHQGADVRGGYTDAKLFKIDNDSGYFGSEDVYGSIDDVDVSNAYDNYHITNDDNNKYVKITKNSTIKLYLN